MEVIVKERAKRSIIKIALYIFKKGYPKTSVKFTERLRDFSINIGIFPDKYPICRQKYFAKKDFHCATFENNYILIYKISNSKVYIYNIVRSCRLR